MTQGAGTRSAGEHVPVRVHTQLSVQRNRGLHVCYKQERAKMQPWGHRRVFGCMGGRRGKRMNDKSGFASQSHFLNALYPKSYKSNIPFWPYWSHSVRQSHLFPWGFELNCALACLSPPPLLFPPLYIYSPACYQRRVRACIQIGRRSGKQTTPIQR